MLERKIERRGTEPRTVKLPGKPAIRTSRTPSEIAEEIRAARVSRRIEAGRK